MFLRLAVPSGVPSASERIMNMVTAALVAAVVVSLGLGLSLAIALAHAAPGHSPGTADPGAGRPDAGLAAASSGVAPVHLVLSAGSMADYGTTLAIPPLSGIMRSVTVTDATTGAVLAGELSGDAAT